MTGQPWARLRRAMFAFQNLGLRDAIHYWLQRRRQFRRPDGEIFALRSPHARYPLLARARSSDIDVFYQIFVEREYQCIDALRTDGLIIDAGSNCGYSAAYLLSRYPCAKLIAIEPDAGNFAVLEQNLAPYANRAQAHLAALWPRPGRLAVDERPFRDGRAWARRVRECAGHETGTVTAVDIGSLLAQSGYDRIAILKMDIEGAEAPVLAGSGEWIDRVDLLLVELHDDSSFGSASEALAGALAGRRFVVRRCGELRACLRETQ